MKVKEVVEVKSNFFLGWFETAGKGWTNLSLWRDNKAQQEALINGYLYRVIMLINSLSFNRNMFSPLDSKRRKSQRQDSKLFLEEWISVNKLHSVVDLKHSRSQRQGPNLPYSPIVFLLLKCAAELKNTAALLACTSKPLCYGTGPGSPSGSIGKQ